ncbi:Panacea domain-containing protein, partial [Peptococcus simiae]|uniref:Panacea domain-containing protein n=1 Tax=Peptococcus simiae TaxID=1643805 RepID=UPI0039809373
MKSVIDVANWFLSKDSMTHKKIQKLCYYAQAWYCALYDGTPLFKEEIQAWVHGPV